MAPGSRSRAAGIPIIADYLPGARLMPIDAQLWFWVTTAALLMIRAKTKG